MSYIQREALIKCVTDRTLIFEESTPVDEVLATQMAVVLEEIEEAPTADVVEVVRCKDCRHFDLSLTGTPVCTIEERSPIMVSRQHYCSYGERRKNAVT